MPIPGKFPTIDFQAILVTGASSGIGREIALAYSRPGVELHLGARDPERLAATASECRRLGAKVMERRVDVTDRTSMEAWIVEADGYSPLDLVIANAGIYAGTHDSGDEPGDQARAVFETNVTGVLNTVLPVIPAMRRRHWGHIAIVSSFAGFRGHGMMPAYSGSKAAVRVWGEGLREWLAGDGVRVTVICPGKVYTPLSPITGPHVVSAPVAAQIIRRGIGENRPRVAFPTDRYPRAWASAMLPPALREWVSGLTGKRG